MTRNFGRGFREGLLAGIVALALATVLRVFLGWAFIPEIATQTLFSVVPGELESRAVGALGYYAKYLSFGISMIMNILLYGFLGIALLRLFKARNGEGPYKASAWYSLSSYGLFLAISAVLLETTEVLTQPTSIPLAALHLIPPQLAFGLSMAYLIRARKGPPQAVYDVPPQLPPSRFSRRRRLFVRAASAGALASVLLYYGFEVLIPKRQSIPVNLSSKPSGQPSEASLDEQLRIFNASEVTPNDIFYVVDINLVPPSVDAKSWSLRVTGSVGKPLTLTDNELRAMPAVEQYATLECVSNEIGGDLKSNAMWKGVRLKDILRMAEIKPSSEYIIFRCADMYDVGIPLEKALQEGTILAYGMNGSPLPQAHGHPLRAIVPGVYGMMNAKWISEIEVAEKVHRGFWQRKGWSNDARYQTHSTIVMPGDSPLRERFRGLILPKVLASQKSVIAGVAFSGDRGISKVEVSVDGGKTWQVASVKEPLSEYTWVLWKAEWLPQRPGDYTIMVRTTDRSGTVQLADIRSPFPAGATGYHVVDVKVHEVG